MGEDMRNDVVAIYIRARLPSGDGEGAAQATVGIFRTNFTADKFETGSLSMISAVKEVAEPSIEGSTAMVVLIILGRVMRQLLVDFCCMVVIIITVPFFLV